jgi:hypothetical protein
MRARPRDSLLPGMEEFFAFPPLCAVVVLAVNDAFLKPLFHNALTGKLSDFAGCFFLPLYVSALLSLVGSAPRERRLLLGAAFTVLLFAPVKLWAEAGAALCAALAPAAQVLGIGALHIVADRSDLWALWMVPLAVASALPVLRSRRWEAA